MGPWTHKGIQIAIRDNGYFAAGKDLGSFATLNAARDAIDKATAIKKTKRLSHAAPCLIESRKAFGEDGAPMQQATYLGMHVGSNAVRVVRNGKRVSIDRYAGIFAVPKEKADFEKRLVEYQAALITCQKFKEYMYPYKVKIPFVRRDMAVVDISKAEQELATALMEGS